MNAVDFTGIPEAVRTHPALRDRILDLVRTQAIAGRATEGPGRETALREILARFFSDESDLAQSAAETASQLPRSSSPHASDNKVFARGWEERLVRTQVSRFYNQAVLGTLVEQGAKDCFVDHSSCEEASTQCSRYLAGRRHDPQVLLDRLIRSYQDGKWDKSPKIPDHPHCTHTVQA